VIALSVKKPMIESDGRTVWVNAPALIGRFGVQGIDIHRPIEEQAEGGECLYCTHAPTTLDDWRTFQAKMKEFYGVTVSDRYMPERFR
jgi:hypothetical protein